MPSHITIALDIQEIRNKKYNLLETMNWESIKSDLQRYKIESKRCNEDIFFLENDKTSSKDHAKDRTMCTAMKITHKNNNKTRVENGPPSM